MGHAATGANKPPFGKSGCQLQVIGKLVSSMLRSRHFALPLLCGFLAVVSPSAFLLASGCSVHSAAVSYAANKNHPAGFYDTEAVQRHMNFVMSSNLDRYAPDGTSTLSCVDARSDDPIIGTPGGDLAEFAMGLYIYNFLTNNVQSYASVQSLFRQFMEKEISASRPFYFHTDDSRLKQVFKAVGDQLGQTITILPSRTPPTAELNVWVAELVKSYAQGCGHIRLMIDMPVTYGLANPNIIQWLIRAFYEELWAADTDAKRAKLSFIAKIGPLQGKAIAIVSNKQGSCAGYSPAIPPNVAGSSMFVYTPSAASAFRSTVMSRFFAAQGSASWSTTTFQTEVNKLFDIQLGATLTHLIPANQSSLISVGVTTFGSPVKDCAGVLGGPAVLDACGNCGGAVKDSTKCIGATSSAASSAPISHQSQSGSVAAGVAGGILYLIVIAIFYCYSNQKKKSAANNSVKAAASH
jgi:hypothetical protein